VTLLSTAMTIVRTISEDEIDAVADLTARIFGDPEEYDAMFRLMAAAYRTCPFMPPRTCWVAEVDGRLVAKLQLLDFRMRIGGSEIMMAGMMALAAEPDENHKGYAKDLILQAIPGAIELGYDMGLGFAQRGTFYRKIGAFPAMPEYEIEIDVRTVPRLKNDTFHPWQESELPALIDHYNRANEGRTGTLVRIEAHWPWMVRKAELIHICDGGYIGLRQHADQLEIREVGGTGEAFHHAALCKIADLARAAGIRKITGAVPPDHPLIEAAFPYGVKINTEYTKKSGCFGLVLAPIRLLENLRDEFEARLWASKSVGTCLDLTVSCNGESTRLSLDPNASSLCKLQLELSTQAILHLVMGYRPVRSVLFDEGFGRSDEKPLPDAEEIRLLETIWPQGHPFMWHTDRY
jgi:predicted acetyltransferase